MANGNTTTDALADSLPSVIASARAVREYEGASAQLFDKETLGQGIGLTWNEITLAQLTAQHITETTVLDNPQQMTDTIFSITPTVSAIHTFTTDRVAARISKNAFAKTGGQAQNAIQRLKDEDCIVVFDGGTSLGGVGTTLSYNVLSGGVARIQNNPTEPGKMPINIRSEEHTSEL